MDQLVRNVTGASELAGNLERISATSFLRSKRKSCCSFLPFYRVDRLEFFPNGLMALENFTFGIFTSGGRLIHTLNAYFFKWWSFLSSQRIFTTSGNVWTQICRSDFAENDSQASRGFMFVSLDLRTILKVWESPDLGRILCYAWGMGISRTFSFVERFWFPKKLYIC